MFCVVIPQPAQIHQAAGSRLLGLFLLQIEKPPICGAYWQNKLITAVAQLEWSFRGPGFPGESLQGVWMHNTKPQVHEHPAGTLANGRQVMAGSFGINSFPSLTLLRPNTSHGLPKDIQGNWAFGYFLVWWDILRCISLKSLLVWQRFYPVCFIDTICHTNFPIIKFILLFIFHFLIYLKTMDRVPTMC